MLLLRGLKSENSDRIQKIYQYITIANYYKYYDV